MLKAIVFDFDGVIVDSEPLHFEAMRAVAAPLGVTFDYREYLDELIGFDDRDAFRHILAKAGHPVPASQTYDQRLRELMDEKQRAFEDRVRAGVEPIPGAIELVDATSVAMPIAIASGATVADIELILASLSRRERFDAIVAADHVERSKPDPSTYTLAYEQLAAKHPHLSLQPGECLAIEDTVAGLVSAKQAGLRTLAVTTTSPAASLDHAERVVTDLVGLTPATLHQWFDE